MKSFMSQCKEDQCYSQTLTFLDAHDYPAGSEMMGFITLTIL